MHTYINNFVWYLYMNSVHTCTHRHTHLHAKNVRILAHTHTNTHTRNACACAHTHTYTHKHKHTVHTGIQMYVCEWSLIYTEVVLPNFSVFPVEGLRSDIGTELLKVNYIIIMFQQPH